MKAITTRLYEPCTVHLPSVEEGHGYPADCPACMRGPGEPRKEVSK